MQKTESKKVIVIDNGSCTIKAGFSGEGKPETVFRSYVGRPIQHNTVINSLSKKQDLFAGRKATENKGILSLSHPIKHGIIVNSSDAEQLWRSIYTELKLHIQERPVLISEAPLNPKDNKNEIAKIFLETFNVPGLLICSQAILALYSAGATTGVVLDCGEGVCDAVPIYDGFALTNCTTRMDFAGGDVTDNLKQKLRLAGYPMHTSSEHEIVRAIKERECYLKPDVSSIMENNEISYQLPDGTQIKLGNELYTAPEILFDPTLAGFEFPGVHELLYKSIMKTDSCLKSAFFSEIYLAGGSTMIKGFNERFINEMDKLKPDGMKMKIYAPPDRQNLCWLGGAILSDSATFKSLMTTRKELDEFGSNVLHIKSL